MTVTINWTPLTLLDMDTGAQAALDRAWRHVKEAERAAGLQVGPAGPILAMKCFLLARDLQGCGATPSLGDSADAEVEGSALELLAAAARELDSVGPGPHPRLLVVRVDLVAAIAASA